MNIVENKCLYGTLIYRQSMFSTVCVTIFFLATKLLDGVIMVLPLGFLYQTYEHFSVQAGALNLNN